MPLLPPELTDEIASRLHQHDFTQLVRVNKEWNQAWTPYLWKEMTVGKGLLGSTFLTPESQRGLIRQGHHHIRTLGIQSEYRTALQLFQDLSALYLTNLHIRSGQMAEDEFESLVKVLDKTQTHLRVLQIDALPPSEESTTQLLRTISQSLNQLQHLSLFSRFGWPATVAPPVAREFLETCSSELVSLTLGLNFYQEIQSTENTIAMRRPILGSRTHPRLKRFCLSTGCKSDTTRAILPTVLLTFLRGCTNLEFVDDMIPCSLYQRSWIHGYPRVIGTLRDLMGVHLRELYVSRGHSDMHQDKALALLIADTQLTQDKSCPELWRSIYLEVCPIPNTATSRALIEASERGLQKLFVAAGDRLDSRVIQSILHRGQDLREMYFSTLPTLIVSDILHSPWACRWLTVLNIRIGGIPRPDVLMDYRGRPIPSGTPLHSGTMDGSRAIQRKVYAQLGALVHLQELCLGMWSLTQDLIQETMTDANGAEAETVFYDPLLQLTCLEMTLDSGLDLLAGLKDMRMLSVENMEHRIGIRELSCMTRNWANLLSIRGLTLQGVEKTLSMKAGREYGTKNCDYT
ncbi:hypothetical protein BGX29_000817 [Mortierella sp. GBA35]|nr:hypothetical protein BGX23_011144 [Mortierella sp. AD031]KAF9087460.1 hypothetical protein BGX29_000817 [Mortierella sp. GBA35]KAG0208700.1 hypothetical protein BGX33_006076 [Mortierella sp. NVP41]